VTEPAGSITQRIARSLESLCLWLMLVLLAVGASFVIKYRSEGAIYWRYSSRYLIGVVVPYFVGSLILGALVLVRDRCAAALGQSLGRIPRPVSACGFLLAAAGAVVYAFRVSDEFVSILMMLAGPGAIALFWAMTARAASGKPRASSANLILACAPVLACGILLFAVELPGLIAGSPLAIWGDASTFATLFPREPPYIGAGGRLKPGLDVRMRAPEYPSGALLRTNSGGFRNTHEFDAAPEAGELRVLSLGDSFSTGYCADQDRFFGSLLERSLASHRRGGVSVMNAEVSDPAYGLYYLQQFGLGYHPAIVIYGLSGNDMMQAEQFSGDGRTFRLDPRGRLLPNPDPDLALESGWVRFRDLKYPASAAGPPSRPGVVAVLLSKLVRFRLLAAFAGLAEREGGTPVDMPGYAEEYERADGHKRFIDGSANLGFFYRGRLEPVERMYAAAFDLIAAMDQATREAGGRFLLVIYPQRYQVQPPDWAIMRDRWALDDDDFDLESANRRLEAFCRASRVACCDLLTPFRAAAGSHNLFLPGGDTHINRYGHEAAAAAVERCLEPLAGPG